VGPAAGARITGVVLVTHDGRKGGINWLAGSKFRRSNTALKMVTARGSAGECPSKKKLPDA
jgi:hypothetical protein